LTGTNTIIVRHCYAIPLNEMANDYLKREKPTTTILSPYSVEPPCNSDLGLTNAVENEAGLPT